MAAVAIRGDRNVFLEVIGPGIPTAPERALEDEIRFVGADQPPSPVAQDSVGAYTLT